MATWTPDPTFYPSARMAMQAPAEKLAYMAILSVEGTEPDALGVDDLDPQCAIPGLVLNSPKKAERVDAILNNSFGMLGINSTLIVKRYAA